MTRLFCLLLLMASALHGEFYKTRLGHLKTAEEEQAILNQEFQMRFWQRGAQSRVPIARFEKFAFAVPDLNRPINERANRKVSEGWLLIELDQPGAVRGFLDLWDREEERWRSLECQIEPKKLVKCTAEETRNAREWRAWHLLQSNARGGLWFRSQVQNDDQNRRRNDFDETFTTLSGGRALAENLALDRELILGEGLEGEDVEISSIKGVTVAPIPWDEWMPKGKIQVDPLSLIVPEDQHFLVVPSLKDLFALIDRLEETGTPILQSFSTGDQYRGLPSRYRKQMGLDLPEALARLLPVESVAVTGGDPFFPTGSDVAVVLETGKVDFVFSSLKASISAKAGFAGATAVKVEGGFGFRNQSRTFSCHVAKLKGAVVISNSLRQLDRFREVAGGKAHALGDTDEYRFFRHRYPVGAGESAYVFISDACLRRWSGPEVRIAASRRSRALAALAQITSQQIEGVELSQEFKPLLGEVSLARDRVMSANYGSLGFLTPISELGITKVSPMEKAAYERWRRGYESGWARFFDPIAIRFEINEESEELDMTVLPLRVDSDYESFMNLAGKAVLSRASQTAPGESLFHFAMAVDHESEMFKESNVSLIDFLPMLKVNPLGWMGESFSMTMGESIAWRGNFSEESLRDLPVLVRIDVESRLKLALFLTGVKGSIEASSPDLVRWETRRHEGRKYVAVIGDPEEVGVDVSIYYAATSSALLVSLNEGMLKRALDREKDVVKGRKGKGQIHAETSPNFLKAMGEFADGQGLEERRRRLSWSALPLLNEWFQSRDAKDPVRFYEERFAIRITCPGGKGYRWNAKDLTMESVAFGHPGSPRDEAKPLALLEKFQAMEMTASFEEGGMRMKVALDKESRFEEPDLGGAPRPADDEVVSAIELAPSTQGMVQKFETKYDPDEGEEAEVTLEEYKVEEVSRKGKVTIVRQSFRSMDVEDGKAGEMQSEFGPKGLRLLTLRGEEGGNLIVDQGGFELPGELWPGQVFRVRKDEWWKEKGQTHPVVTDEMVKVIGWENIEGPEGKELKALRLERDSHSIYRRDQDRTKVTEWHVRGLGLVRSESKSRWLNATTVLKEVVMPGKE